MIVSVGRHQLRHPAVRPCSDIDSISPREGNPCPEPASTLSAERDEPGDNVARDPEMAEFPYRPG